MPVPTTWTELLDAPTFVVNLDRRPDRWSAIEPLIRAAGFTKCCVSAMYGQDANGLRSAWTALGNPAFDSGDPEMPKPGHQWCLIPHLDIWSTVLSEHLPYNVVFEDDSEFNSAFAQLAPLYSAEIPLEIQASKTGYSMANT